jgi:hypothetical protein
LRSIDICTKTPSSDERIIHYHPLKELRLPIIGDENQMVVTKKAEPKKPEPKKTAAAKQEVKAGAKSAPKSKK